MSDTSQVLLAVDLVCAALVAGGQLFCLLALIPALPGWPLSTGVKVHQDAMTWRPHRYLRVNGLATLVLSAAIVAIERSGDLSVVLVAGALGLALVNFGVSSREWVINDEVNAAPEGTVPDDYPELRKKWDERHLVRTIASIGALLCLTVALGAAQ